MTDIVSLLGSEAENLLSHQCKGISNSLLHLPGPDYVDRVVAQKDVRPGVLRALQTLFDHGRLGGSGYLSILPVDQGIEHSGGASFAPNPIYFDPENIVRLAIEGGCNAVASTLGVLGSVARKYAHKIPFIVKINHNEILTYPEIYDQTLFASVDQAFDMGAVAVGATVYYGSPESRRQIQEISEAFAHAHELGMATVLWAYLRNPAFKKDGVDYHTSRRSHRPGQSPRRHYRRRHHQTETGREQRRLHRHQVRQDPPQGVQRTHQRPPHRPDPLSGGELLHGPRRHDQFRRRLRWRRRPRPSSAHRRDQQACRRNGIDLGAQGIPEADAGWSDAAQCNSGRVFVQRYNHRLISDLTQGIKK